MHNGELIVADGVCFSAAGREVLRGESLSVIGGGLLVICGGNGAGKTTLIKILAGLLPPDDGNIRYHFDGGNIDNWREDVIYIGHKTGLCPELTPMENLRVFASMRARPPVLDLSAALAEWNAGINIPCARLSAGQLRRAALSRLSALAGRVWLLDEPTASMDAGGREHFFVKLRHHIQGGGAAAISCHHHNELPDDLTKAAGIIRL